MLFDFSKKAVFITAVFCTVTPVLALSSMLVNAQAYQANVNEAEYSAQRYLFKHYPSLNGRFNSEPMLKTYVVRAKESRLGLSVVTFSQSYDGIPIYQKKASILIKADNSVGSANINLALEIPTRSFSTDDELREHAISAVKLGFSHLGYDVAANIYNINNPLELSVASPNSHIEFNSPNIVLTKLWFDKNEELLPAFSFTLNFKNTESNKQYSHAYIVADSSEGYSQSRILEQGSLLSHVAHEYTVFAGDTGDLLTSNATGAIRRIPPLFANPRDPSFFAYNPPSVHVRPLGPVSTPAGPWLTSERGRLYGTSGNHVSVCIETPLGQTPATEENCGKEGWESVPYSSDRAFNWQYNPDNPLSYESRRASAVNIFYLYNQLHDFFYDFGFDESAGNAQRDNYGRGGEQGDPLNVLVFNTENINNATTRTTADGFPTIINMHPFTTGPKPSLNDFSITLSASLSEESSTELSIHENLTGVAYSYLGQQVFGSVSGLTAALEFENDDGCTDLLNTQNLKDKIVMYPLENCDITEANLTLHANLKALKEAGAKGIIFGVNEQKITEYQNNIPLSGRFSDPLPHMFLSTSESFYEIFYDPYFCDTSGDHCTPYMLTLKGLDNAVIRDPSIGYAIPIHEWGHYLTVRLVGTTISATSQYRALLEGWADFLATFFRIQKQDSFVLGNENWMGVYGFFDWAINNPFFGLRRIPYTTDFLRNALTVENISNNVEFSSAALGHTVVRSRNPNSEAHNAGEIWATVLLEAYVALLNDSARLSFEQAQERMLSYVVMSMKMLSPIISFADAREAFLNVAYSHDPEDYDILKRAFARRGMGVNFTAPGRFSTTLTQVENSFDVDFQSLQNVSSGILTNLSPQDIDGFKETFGDITARSAADFITQLQASAPACVNANDVSYGMILIGYGSNGDTDIGRFNIKLSEAAGSNIVFDNDGVIEVDGISFNGSVNAVVPFAYLRTRRNISTQIDALVSAKSGVSLPEISTFNLVLNSDTEIDAINTKINTIDINMQSDCTLQENIQGVSQTAETTLTPKNVVFNFAKVTERVTQARTITVTNTTNKRQNLGVTIQNENIANGIELRYPRSLHIPANSSRTFTLRAIVRPKQLQQNTILVNGSLIVGEGDNRLDVPYAIEVVQ